MTITPELLLNAYAAGVFPMSEGRDDPDLFWVDPKLRGIIPLDGFHISRSLARRIKRGGYSVSINGDYRGVMEACAERSETWINAEILALYTKLHEIGYGHSLEIWSEDGELIGGVYGLALGTAYFGESMFSRRTDASKLALAWLVDHLRRAGFTLFDTQFLTPHLASLGAIEIPRAEYHARLSNALENVADIYSVPLEDDPSAVVQRNTQTS